MMGTGATSEGGCALPWTTAETLYITQAYFWNSDPGQGNGVALIVFDGDFDASLSIWSWLANDVFNVRVRDVDGLEPHLDECIRMHR